LGAIQSAQQTLPELRFDCGQSDVLINANRQLHQSLMALGIAHEYEEFEGSHNWDYWQTHLVDTLNFFSRILKKHSDS
jgi:enterochelin esterase-like enzyme